MIVLCRRPLVSAGRPSASRPANLVGIWSDPAKSGLVAGRNVTSAQSGAVITVLVAAASQGRIVLSWAARERWSTQDPPCPACVLQRPDQFSARFDMA